MKKLLIILTVLLVLGSACKKDFLNVDENNPNSASAVPPNLVLPAALNTTARIVTNPDNYNFIYLWYGAWCISGGYSQPINLVQYNLLNSDYQANWDNYYLNLQNYDYIEKNSTTDQQKPYAAIAKIMKAYIFQILVDTYGNIPYSEALKGSATPQILKPKYDDQVTVYESLVTELDAAMALINSSPVDAAEVGSYDIIYQGDMSKWLKFANTLKLRLLVNQSGVAGRASYIAGALASSSTPADFIGVGEGAMSNPGYLNSANKMNPFWENFYKTDGSQQADGLTYTMAGQDACDFLNDNNDPRKLLIFAPYSGTSIKGNYFGALLLGTVPTTSQIGPGLLRSFDQSAPLLTDFESLLIQAEAAQKGIITGDVKSLYESGVTQSIVYLGGNSAQAAVYLSQAGKPLVNFTESTNHLQTIITQKWIALNGVNPMPLWTDYRRTHFPSFLHFSADPAKLNAQPPVRLLYPQTEISTNNDNVVAQGAISLFSSHIFWDPFSK
jgi:hypothetical protein